jgi:ribosomal protein S27AE
VCGKLAFCQKEHEDHSARHVNDKNFVCPNCGRSTQNL